MLQGYDAGQLFLEASQGTTSLMFITAVLKTRRLNVYCRDAHFCRQEDQMCGQWQSSYTPNPTTARRNWTRQLHHLADWTLSVAAIEKKKKTSSVLCCPVKISILFNCLCVWILFQNANSHLFFPFLSLTFGWQF